MNSLNLPESNDNYAEKEYWDKRYEQEESFDWFVKYESFRHLAKKHIKSTDRILILGCGNSPMSADIYNDGFHDILNVDYSDVVITAMRNRHVKLTGMTWVVMDIKDMSELDSQSFDVILEKGTLDALLVEEKDPWNVSEDAEDMIHIILNEISRLLRSGGRFISITFAQPHFRLPMYARDHYDWNLQTDIIGTSFHYFFYTMTKGITLSGADRDLRSAYVRRRLTKPEAVVFVSDSEDEDYLLKSVHICDNSFDSY